MNLFTPPKRVKKLYLRQGEHEFFLLSLFIFNATTQKWNVNDIKKVVQEAKKKDYQYLITTLRNHSSN